jgi:hypothetical protein
MEPVVEPTEIGPYRTTEEVAAGIIWNGAHEDSYCGAVKDMVRTLRDLPIPEMFAHDDVAKYLGAQEFFTRFLYEHVVDGFGLKDDTMKNAWDLHRALMELARKRSSEEE